jgi:hypothetical protein
MDEFQHPPLDTTAGERISTDYTKFADCLKRLNAFATKAGGTVTEQTCSFSDRWGRVVRADVAFQHIGSDATVCVVCWSEAGSGIKFVASVGGCCGG